jgi:transcriptional regulator with XRE-family HTH domain
MPAVMPPALEYFAGQLTAHREQRDWSKAQLASRMKFDASYVSHVENGTKVPTRAFAERADDAFKLPGTFVILHKVLELGEQDSETVADSEQGALALVEWEQRVVPGLLQAPDYARAHLSTSLLPDQVERELALRLKRQKILGALVAGWFILDESVLRRVYGSADVMRGQLAHLEDVSARPNIGIQVMPYASTHHPGSYGPLRVVEYADKPAILLTEGPGSGRLSSDQKVVLTARHDLDGIKAAALSIRESVEYIRHIRETAYERQLA